MRLAVAAALLVLPLGLTAQSSPEGRRATAYGWRRMAPTTADPSDVAAALSAAAEVSSGAETDLAVALDAADGWRLDNGTVEVNLRYGSRPLKAPEPAQASGKASGEDSQATEDGTVVMLYLPESINGARILTETDEVGHFLVDMSVVHGGPGAQVGFRNTRQMADRNPEFVADDGSVLKGTLRGGWLEVEFQVRRSQDCLEEYADGRSQGFSEGHRSGFMDGHKQGSEQGIAYGQHKGYAEGLETGQRQKCKFADRHESWYLTGYVHGYNRVEYDSPHDIDSETVPLTAEEDMCSAEEAVCSVTDRGNAVIKERGEPGHAGVRELSPGTSGETQNRTLFPEQIPDDQAQHEILYPEHSADDIVGWFVLSLFGWHLLCAFAGCRWLFSWCCRDGADCADADADEPLLDDEEDDAIFSSSAAAPADQWAGREPEAESSLLKAESLDEYDGPTRTTAKAESSPILGPSTISPPDLSSTVSGASFQHFDMCTPRNGAQKTLRDNYSARRSVGAGLHASSSPVVGWEDWENSFVTDDDESSCDGETESEVCEVALGDDGPCQEAGCTIDVTGGDVAACRGSYVPCGACNGRPLFTSASGAVIFFDACWKMSGPSCPGDCWFEAQMQGRLPPAGHWSPRHGAQSSPVVDVRGSQAKEAAPPCGSSGLPGCMPSDKTLRVAPPTVDVTRIVANDDGKLCFELSCGERWVFDQLPGKGTAGDPKAVL